MATTATLGSVTFNNKSVDPYYTLTDVDGWSTPTHRSQVMERITEPGVVIAENQYSGRVLALRGFIVATTNTKVWSGRATLESTFDLIDTDGTFVVNEPTPKQVTVRRIGPLRMRFLSEDIVEWSCELLAADPTKFSTTQQSQSTS